MPLSFLKPRNINEFYNAFFVRPVSLQLYRWHVYTIFDAHDVSIYSRIFSSKMSSKVVTYTNDMRAPMEHKPLDHGHCKNMKRPDRMTDIFGSKFPRTVSVDRDDAGILVYSWTEQKYSECRKNIVIVHCSHVAGVEDSIEGVGIRTPFRKRYED